MHEYVATVTTPKGGTEAVTVRAKSVEHAKKRLLALGYINPRNIAAI